MVLNPFSRSVALFLVVEGVFFIMPKGLLSYALLCVLLVMAAGIFSCLLSCDDFLKCKG